MFEVLPGFGVAKVDGLFPGETQVDELMLLLFSKTLGPLSPALLVKWTHYSRYFDHVGRRNETIIPDYEMEYDTEDEGSEKQMDEESDAALDGNTECKSFARADLEAEMALTTL